MQGIIEPPLICQVVRNMACKRKLRVFGIHAEVSSNNDYCPPLAAIVELLWADNLQFFFISKCSQPSHMAEKQSP